MTIVETLRKLKGIDPSRTYGVSIRQWWPYYQSDLSAEEADIYVNPPSDHYTAPTLEEAFIKASIAILNAKPQVHGH